MTLQNISPENPAYPAAFKTCVAFKAPPNLTAIGNLELLTQTMIALFCSKQCPGDLILTTYNLVQALRDAEIPIISGFHTPVEQDCLKLLLRGTQPIIHCPARSIHNIRLLPEQQQAIGENRLLLISPFNASYPRVTAKLADKRNELIGAIAHAIVIAYAAPNSKTLALTQRLITSGKSIVIIASPSNPLVQEQGIIGVDIDAIVQRCLDAQISPF